MHGTRALAKLSAVFAPKPHGNAFYAGYNNINNTI